MALVSIKPLWLFIFLLGFGLPLQAAKAQDASPRTVHLATLEWPPFSSERLPEGGHIPQKVRAAFEVMGYQVTVDFLPWARALHAVREETGLDGVFPAYGNEIITRALLLSPPMESSPLGLAEYGGSRTWQKLEDLSPYVIGTVESYANTKAFDQLARQNVLQVETCPDDVTNLYKLAAGRIDMAVIDKNVFQYFLEKDPALQPHKKNFVFNERLLENKDLFVGFRKSKRGAELNKVFAEGLRRIESQKAR